MKASHVIEAGHGWCVPKAALLAAACRAVGIEFGQGYLLGRPASAHELFRVDPGTLPGICPYVKLGVPTADARRIPT